MSLSSAAGGASHRCGGQQIPPLAPSGLEEGPASKGCAILDVSAQNGRGFKGAHCRIAASPTRTLAPGIAGLDGANNRLEARRHKRAFALAFYTP